MKRIGAVKVHAISAALIAECLGLATGWAEDAAKPRFPLTVVGADYLQEIIRQHVATRAPWPIFARTAAAQKTAGSLRRPDQSHGADFEFRRIAPRS